MATAFVPSAFDVPSPLDVDLALARINLAVLRARRGLPLDDKAVRAAALLRDHYTWGLYEAKYPDPIIPEDLVPDEDKRAILQQSLGSIARSEPGRRELDIERADRFVELLSAIANTRKCEAAQAVEVHSLVHALEGQPPAPLATAEFALASR